MTSVPFIIAANNIILVLNGKQHVIHNTNPNFNQIKAALNDEVKLTKLLNPINDIKDIDFRVDHGVVTFRGEEIHSVLTNRIVACHDEGLPFDGLMKFLANCMRNPRQESVDDLYRFLEHGGFPITSDGCFLGYKKIRGDWKDCHSGTFDNHPGARITMPRDEVVHEPNHACGPGLHVGTLNYARGFGGGRIVLVKVNPKDVVSVPYDHNSEKLRACEYLVISEYEDETPIKSVYWEDEDDSDHDYDYEDDSDYEDDEEDDPRDIQANNTWHIDGKTVFHGPHVDLRRRQVADWLVGVGIFPSQKAAELLSKEEMLFFVSQMPCMNPPYETLDYTRLEQIFKKTFGYEASTNDVSANKTDIINALCENYQEFWGV